MHQLGAHWDGSTTHFALFSEHAQRVELCLVDDNDQERRIDCARDGFIWHAHVRGAGPGTRYGYRVHGPWQPAQGLKFNHQVRLLDPYARAWGSPVRWPRGGFAHPLDPADVDRDLKMNQEDATGAPLGLVVDPAYDWQGDTLPRTPWKDTIIYELHVKGFTQLHPGVPEELRGTYAGLAHPAVIAYLRELGVTAIELLPVHAFIDDKHLIDRGLRNYWGYNTLSFFAVEERYAHDKSAGGAHKEFRAMVKALHAAGIEVLLDVVYNHTAEGNRYGPMLSFKGIDNLSYYRTAKDPRHYFDLSGCGNTLNTHHPHVVQLVMDSLRYWVNEMHVDGFRFDLASALGRGASDFDARGGFLTAVQQDPVLKEVKLIAEPWDLGDGGYQLGGFPPPFAEWNGRYRDTMRAFFRGHEGTAQDVGARLTGSRDFYGYGRSPGHSINFITCHDGFTLRDLCAYERKHNLSNGESNNDGSDDNISWNCGVEGPSDDPAIVRLRARQQRNFLAALFFSHGTPMLLAGDERGQTQAGNNNAYCQDNALSWLDWQWDAPRQALFECTKRLVQLRKEHPLLRPERFELAQIDWFRHDGEEMTEDDWRNPATHSIAMRMRAADETLLLLLNASPIGLDFAFPAGDWQPLFDTAEQYPPTRHVVERSVQLWKGA